MVSNSALSKRIIRDRGGFSLVETVVALALLGVISVPAAEFFRLQQRYLYESREAFLQEQRVLSFFENLKDELSMVRYPWWGASPDVETDQGKILVAWSQGGIPRKLVLQEVKNGWKLTVDDKTRNLADTGNLYFLPLLRDDYFRGVQALWRERAFYFYTGQQPFSAGSLEDYRPREVTW